MQQSLTINSNLTPKTTINYIIQITKNESLNIPQIPTSCNSSLFIIVFYHIVHTISTIPIHIYNHILFYIIPPSLSYHSLPIFDYSFQQDPGIDNIYHPLTAIITTHLLLTLSYSPVYPLLPKEGRLPAAPRRSSQAPTPFHAEKSIKLPMLEVSSS